jgi:hypothetical protein
MNDNLVPESHSGYQELNWIVKSDPGSGNGIKTKKIGIGG